MKRYKRLAALALTLVVLLGLCGCSVREASGTHLGTTLDSQDFDAEESTGLRDKKLLYKQQNNTEIVTMYLTVSSGSKAENTDHTWEEINTYSAYDYDEWGVERYQVAGLLQIGDGKGGLIKDEVGYGQVAPNCTVQIRGQSSSLNTQKNYKIRLKDNKGTWRGQQTIALNKHQGDGTRFRNKLGFDLLSDIDQTMSLRTTFVRLYVKDTTAGGSGKFEDYGIYTQVEQLNKTALEAHGLDKRGHLYKINICEFYRYADVIKLKDDPTYDVKAFEEILEIKGDDDHSKLIRLLEKINDYTIPIETVLAEHFDMENLSYWMAFQLLMGNIDTQNRNFYLYSPLNSERWYILAWDNDGMLKRAELALSGRNDYTGWESGISNYWGNVLFCRCLKSESYRAALDAAVEDLYATVLSPKNVAAYAEQYAALLKPLVYKGRDKLYMPVTAANYDSVVRSLSTEVADNYRRYKDSLTVPQPFYIGVPTVSGTKMKLLWDASYDLAGQPLTYTVEIGKDHLFGTTVFKKEGLAVPEVTFDALPAGQYFVRVMAFDTEGKSQYAFDYYVTEKGKTYGTRCFFVQADGSIAEDAYVED